MQVAEATPSAAGLTTERRRARRRAEWRHRRLVLLLMSPWLAGFSVFFGYPLVMSAYLSFNHYDLLSSPRWVGLANYRYLFTVDPQVWIAVRNTLWIIAVAVPLQVIFAFGIALMLSRARRGIGVFRTVFYLPALAPPVAATLGFVYILNPSTSPVILFAVILGVIQGLQYFTQAYVAAGVASGQASQAADVTAASLGYPLDSTLFYPVLLYQHGFSDFQMGYASAMAIVLLLVAFAVTLVILINARRWVHAGAGALK